MEHTPITKLLLKLSPPVMLALLIQSIYNIVDSYFIARYSDAGLTALSIIFPLQLLMTALATGTGTGINILISRMDGEGKTDAQNRLVRSGLFLGLLNYLLFACIGLALVKPYYAVSSDQALVRLQGVQYARIIFLGAFGQFIEANCTKILQAKGNMMVPMIAQVTGAVINVILDPILIFGLSGIPALGISGAAFATVSGQIVSMAITFFAVCRRHSLKGSGCVADCVRIYKAGFPSIVMQSLYTLYIVGLNLILKQFTEDAVTVLGIYYKLQTFFFIPLMGLQQVILPIISFNYGAAHDGRVKDTLKYSTIASCSIMALAAAVFLLFPGQLLSIFSSKKELLQIGCHALRVISGSFIPAGIVMMFTVYFQGINKGSASLFLTILRQVILLVPLAWLFHFIGLAYVWYTFVVTELIAMAASLALYKMYARTLSVPERASKTNGRIKRDENTNNEQNILI